MKSKTTNRIVLYIFILLSLIVIVYSALFIISQQINIKYYFEDCLPDSSANSIPVCQKEFFIELILYAIFLIFYALYGLILSFYYSNNKS